MSSGNTVNEFELIEKYFAPLAKKETGALGLGDDAAILSPPPGKQLVFTTDGLIEGVHFLDNENPQDVAARLIGVNLSDLAAMGSKPWVYNLSLSLPHDISSDWLRKFSKELKILQDYHSISLIGGDTTATRGPLILSMTAIGTVNIGKAILRSGASAEELIYVSGTIGDANLGLSVLKNEIKGLNEKDSNFLTTRYHRPEPRILLGQKLIGLANSATDISDGLIADLGHLASESGLTAIIFANKIPFSDAAKAAFSLNHSLKQQALSGGDDYELLFSVPKKSAEKIIDLSKKINVLLSNIGEFTHTNDGSKDVVNLIDDQGQKITPYKKGFSHF